MDDYVNIIFNSNDYSLTALLKRLNVALKFLKLRQDCWIYFSTGLLGLRNVLRNEERKKLWRNNMLSKVKLKSLRDEVIDTSIATLRKYILRFFGNFTIPAEEFKL
jgi:hypothetical protein